jgi:hypothetical protein
MSPESRYLKIVEWSDEDGCFIGSCPELFYLRNCRLIDSPRVAYERAVRS